MVEIEDPTRRICGLSARSCASLTGTTSKNGNCLHYKSYQRAFIKQSTGLTPGANVVDDAAVGLEGVEGVSIGVKTRPSTAGREYRSRRWPRISHTQPNHRRSDSSFIKQPHPPQPIHGILRSPQVAYTRKCERDIDCTHGHSPNLHIFDTHPVPVLLAQVFRPLWPFFAAGGITFFLVSKAQDTAVRCESFDPSEKASSHSRVSPSPSFSQFPPL
jgi:hypothetical protein